MKENIMKKYLFVVAAVSTLAVPAMADEVGVRAGPVGAGVTVGEDHRDLDRDRDRDHTTVIKEHEPRDRDTIIKKDHDDGVESKTTIHRDND
jgi:Ni/Co efflux regulator RcnB